MNITQYQQSFPQNKYFLISSLFFLDLGILFGGLNALREAELIEGALIHPTHWTTTLFGAMTLLMLGLIYNSMAATLKTPWWGKLGMLSTLGIFVLAILLRYIALWGSVALFDDAFFYGVKIGAGLFIFVILSFFVYRENLTEVRSHPPLLMLVFASLWHGIAVIWFFGLRGLISPMFITAYVYGFFSLTLFGLLSFLLPQLFETKNRPAFVIYRDLIFINISAIALVINDFGGEDNVVLGLIGSGFWGLVGFFFVLYSMDLIYKRGMKPSLVGLTVAMVMFGFFVFDTMMVFVFPTWVNASHAHFMFLGTLVLAIVSIGLAIADDTQETEKEKSSTLRTASIGASVLFVGIILLGFTVGLSAISGIAGILLFLTMISTELTLFRS